MAAPSAAGALVGAGKEAEVFGHGDRVLKLYRSPDKKASAFREAATLATVAALGLPVPQVHAVVELDGRWGIVMGRAGGPSFGEAIRAAVAPEAEYLDAMVALHRRIHATPGAGLPALKARLAARITGAAPLGDASRRRLLDALAGLPDGDRLCHGDFHPLNILGTPGAATVVDWLDAAAGDPAADVCRSWILMEPHAPDFANAYVEAYADAGATSRASVMAWLPVIAAARLAENVPEETGRLLALAERA